MNQKEWFEQLPTNHGNFLYPTGNNRGIIYYGKDIYDNCVSILWFGKYITIKIERLLSNIVKSQGNRYLVTTDLTNEDLQFISSDLTKCMRDGMYWKLDLLKYGLVLEDDFTNYD